MADGSTLDYIPADEAHGAHGLRRLALALLAYPLLAVASLYATWMVGVPRTVFGVLLTFAVPVMGLHLGLVLAGLVDRTVTGGRRFSRKGAAVAMCAVAAWAGALWLLWWDPWRAAWWYFH